MKTLERMAGLLAMALLIAQGPVYAQAAANKDIEVSASAVRSEALLDNTGPKAAKRTLPEGHWLEGTTADKRAEADMVPARIAPGAPRKKIAEYGPAYLEQIGETRVIHLRGSYYDMGYQHGMMLKEEIALGAKLIRTVGMLAWNKSFKKSSREAWQRTSPFIPQKYKDEIKGMADATGLPIDIVEDFTIFPELFHCSGFAVWGKATKDGALLHGRVLDYMREVGLDKWALVIIQEPNDANAFVNVGYSGMIGSVTGMNDKHVAIGEMGGGGGEQWDGMPMTLLVRECLETCGTLEEVRRLMAATPRTCEYYYVISDSKAENGRGSAYGVGSTPGEIQFIAPNQYHELLPRPVEDAVLLSAGSRYQCLANRVEKIYGEINIQIALDIMARGVSMSSNMHNALFKPETLDMWVCNSTIEQPGCNRPYIHYNINALLNEKPKD